MSECEGWRAEGGGIQKSRAFERDKKKDSQTAHVAGSTVDALRGQSIESRSVTRFPERECMKAFEFGQRR